jgi:hypothetical protein
VGKIGSHPAILYPRVRKVQPFLFEAGKIVSHHAIFYSRVKDGYLFCLRWGKMAAILPFFTQEEWAAILFEVGNIMAAILPLCAPDKGK